MTGRITLVTTVEATLTAPTPNVEFGPFVAEEEVAAAEEVGITDWPDTEKELGIPIASAGKVLLDSPSPPPFLLGSVNPAAKDLASSKRLLLLG